MKVYYYGEPSRALVEFIFKIRDLNPRLLRYPLAAILMLIWAFAIPVAFLLIKAGNIGHEISGWCGFDTRDW